MADIVLTIPNDQIARVVDALCAVGGYSGDPDDRPARREFARGVIVQQVRKTVMQHERNQAVAEAMSAVTVDPVTID